MSLEKNQHQKITKKKNTNPPPPPPPPPKKKNRYECCKHFHTAHEVPLNNCKVRVLVYNEYIKNQMAHAFQRNNKLHSINMDTINQGTKRRKKCMVASCRTTPWPTWQISQ